MLQRNFKSYNKERMHANNLLFELCKDFNIYLTFVGKFPHVGKIAQISLDPLLCLRTPTMFKRMENTLLRLRETKNPYYV